jgi:predicted nucleotidyltransferase
MFIDEEQALKMNTPSYLPPNLTAEQRDAVLHSGGPLLVIAGLGSGKTETVFVFVTRCIMNREEILARLRAHRTDLERLSVRSLALFGSAARGAAGPSSDVDLLVEFSQPVGAFHFLEVKEFLERILGCPVDLVTPAALRPQLRERILAEAIDAA